MTIPNLTSAVDFVAAQSLKHDAVASVEQLDVLALRIVQKAHGAVTVAAVSEDLLDDDGVQALLEAYPHLAGIVNSGRFVHYSGSAKRRARQHGTALHTFREYMSALGRESFASHEDGLVPWALKTFDKHRRVTSVEQICESRIKLNREGLDAIEFVPTNIYTLGVAELMETLEWHPGIDAVVNFISYNQYTEEAKTRARQVNVGLFTPNEMFGALNFEGRRFYGYERSGDSR
jgi:hypothetical protein